MVKKAVPKGQLKRIFTYMKQYKLLMSISIFFAMAFAIFEVFSTLYIEVFVDTIKEAVTTKDKSLYTLILISFQYIGVRSAKEIGEYFFDILSGTTAGRFVFDLRKDIYRKLNALPYKYFSTTDKSQITSRFVNDVDKLRELIESLFQAVYYICVSLLYIIIMFTRHVKLTLIFILLVPSMLIIIKAYGKRISFSGKKMLEQLAIFHMTLKDYLNGIRIIKAYGTDRYEARKFKQDNIEYFNRFMENTRLNATFSLLEGIVILLAAAIVSAYGGYEVMKGTLGMGAFVFIFSALGEIHESISDLIEMISATQTYLYASTRVFELIDSKVDSIQVDNPIVLKNVEGKIEFENVKFKYQGADEYAIKGISFAVEAGKSIAIVGRSGSGKSTLANLLLRLYELQEGCIKIDGVKLEDVSLKDYRKQLGIVPQDTYLFYDTIYKNITYGVDNLTREQVEDAASKAYVLEFVRKLPEGLNTFVGEEGSSLSGGQKQRISIARALVRNPKILILDEATSALDAASEAIITSTLMEVMKGKTSVIITHKIPMAMKADSIIVMDNGEIREHGTHDELMEIKGLYHSFYVQQFL